MISVLARALVFLLPGIVCANVQLDSQPYLTQHEQRVFDALNNIDGNFDGFMDVFAKNAYCELTFGKQSDDINIKSGPCRDVFNDYGNMVQYKVIWYPITNTHPKHPEKGMLSHVFVNYGLTETGCEGLVVGTSEMKFNIGGKVTDFRGHSTETSDFINCIDGNKSKKIAHEEIYLAPHEQNVYDAMDNINQDFDAFADVFAVNAQCSVISGQKPADIDVKSGPCKEVWSKLEGNVIRNKIMWTPVTNTHAEKPEQGVLAVKFLHYALAENQCEGLFVGTANLKFNKDGLVSDMKSYSSELMDFMDCIDTGVMKFKS